jgi:hypothetical protein
MEQPTGTTHADAAPGGDVMLRLSGLHETSPFELMSALGSKVSTHVPAAPTRVAGGAYSGSDGGMRVNHGWAPRVVLPFQVDRRDIPFVPAFMATSRTLPSADEYATRMTAREQG